MAKKTQEQMKQMGMLIKNKLAVAEDSIFNKFKL